MRRPVVLCAAILALGVSVVLALGIGAVHIPADEVLYRLVYGDGLIWKFRLPRALMAIFAGAGMAVAGCLLQVGLRNPLAAPDVTGVTAGGGAAAVIALLGAGPLPAHLLTPVVLVGSFFGAALVLALSRKRISDPIQVTLTGVAVSVGLGALTQLLLVKAAPEAGAAMAWLKGSLYARSLSDAIVVGPIVTLTLVVVLLFSKHLDTLQLSDPVMAGIGVNTVRWRLVAVGLAVLCASAAVSAAGVLGFAGLIVPHLTRLLVGGRLSWQAPIAALIGAALVVGCDAFGRWIFSPTEIPVGALIAVVGAPYFVFLLLRLTSGRPAS